MSESAPTPQERLANSRKAIVGHMLGGTSRKNRTEQDREGHDFNQSAGTSRWSNFRNAVASWWQHHPAHVALDIAQPLIGKYANEQPLKLLGIAAAAGALIMLVRPWRMVTLGGVLLAAVKSSGVSSALLSMLSSPRADDQQQAQQQ